MKQIQLTYGKLAIIDDEDFDGLNQHRWFALKTRHEGLYYAARREGKKTFLMHRQILKLTEKGLTVDHIDGDGLNNQKNNIRIATYSENNRNRKSFKNSSSKYLGVYWSTRRNRWVAQIIRNGKIVYAKDFRNEIEAALAYNENAIELHGGFANLNKIDV